MDLCQGLQFDSIDCVCFCAKTSISSFQDIFRYPRSLCLSVFSSSCGFSSYYSICCPFLMYRLYLFFSVAALKLAFHPVHIYFQITCLVGSRISSKPSHTVSLPTPTQPLLPAAPSSYNTGPRNISMSLLGVLCNSLLPGSKVDFDLSISLLFYFSF